MVRTFDEASATIADDGQYDAEHDDKKATHAADYYDRLNGHFTRHYNDNNRHHSVLCSVYYMYYNCSTTTTTTITISVVYRQAVFTHRI